MIGAVVILTDPIFQGLAISLLFGLASSTLLTVLLIPTYDLSCAAHLRHTDASRDVAGRKAGLRRLNPVSESMLTVLRHRFANRHAGFAIRFAVLIALVLAAFAHRAAIIAGPIPAKLAAYFLPDGTLPDICLTGDVVDTGHDEHGAVACEFCLIAGGAGLPAPVADGSALYFAMVSGNRTVVAQTDLSPFPACANAPVRGPPGQSA